jgi:hypothetical protein
MTEAAKMPALAEEGLWVAVDVAHFLKMSISWVRKKSAAGELPFLRIGGSAIRYKPVKDIPSGVQSIIF